MSNLSKYQPRTTSECLGNASTINALKKWIVSFDSNKPKNLKKQICVVDFGATDKISKSSKTCAIVTGGHGIGKTTIVQCVLNELGYQIKTIDLSKLRTNQDIKETLHKLIHTKSIIDIINENNQPKAIVIDDFESITTNIERNFVVSLIMTNENYWFCPVIFVSTCHHNKLLAGVRKESAEFPLDSPGYTELSNVLKRIIDGEKIKFNSSDYSNIRDLIIEHAQHDYRRMMNLIQDIINMPQPITYCQIEEYVKYTVDKDIDYDLFSTTTNIMFNYNGISDSMKQYETDKVLLPLMIHQNYIKRVNNNIKNQISHLMSQGDVIENYIYGEQSWDLNRVHAYYTCVNPSYIMSQQNNRTIPNLEFPIELNKMSIKKINKKNIINAGKDLNSMNIDDFVFLNKIICELLSQDKTEECVELLSGYNMSYDSIDSILKINKINAKPNTPKFNLTMKQKRILSTNLN